ncbi:MAG TPA: hypothetical protein VEG25_08340 [Burkholderiales bacterium]|nr:hypothetical protein [Burkholderiales bacterium]
MVTSSLTGKLTEDGETLLKAPDAANVPVDAAFCFYFPEEGFWKLMLSFQGIEKEGPKAAYATIQKALLGIPEEHRLAHDDVAIAKKDAPLVQLLRVAIRTAPGISGIRFSNNVINGQLIADAHIYRLT